MASVFAFWRFLRRRISCCSRSTQEQGKCQQTQPDPAIARWLLHTVSCRPTRVLLGSSPFPALFQPETSHTPGRREGGASSGHRLLTGVAARSVTDVCKCLLKPTPTPAINSFTSPFPRSSSSGSVSFRPRVLNTRVHGASCCARHIAAQPAKSSSWQFSDDCGGSPTCQVATTCFLSSLPKFAPISVLCRPVRVKTLVRAAGVGVGVQAPACCCCERWGCRYKQVAL